MKSKGLNEHTPEHVIQRGGKVTVLTHDTMTCFKFATININGLHSETRIGMLCEFLRSQDIDIVFLQEVTNHALHDLGGYNTYLNVGTDMRETSIVTKQDLQITNINKLPSGRGMTAGFRGIKLINIYAPSGTAKKRERE
jgi:exonuclease III